MALRDLAIWNRKNDDLEPAMSANPLHSFKNEIDRLFDSFWGDGGRFTSSLLSRNRLDLFSPKVDICDDDGKLSVSAELPGMDEKDIQVSLENGLLIIKGEKRLEEEKRGREYYRVERSYGSFQRSIRLPDGVDADKIKASFKNGVLQVTLPKTEEAKKNVRQIKVSAS